MPIDEEDNASSPHARGDGPFSPPYPLRGVTFSPRAWGWSGRVIIEILCEKVLPTRVGMVRIYHRHDIAVHRSPHARGDGPAGLAALETRIQFSPRAWGWSARRGWPDRPELVLPTRVGMVRQGSLERALQDSSPHARGDGPAWGDSSTGCGAFSPRAWGWSELRLAQEAFQRVLPTRVGMVRIACVLLLSASSSPHARGDGPESGTPCSLAYSFSPRAWGWSEHWHCLPHRSAVLPTRVGMVRDRYPRTSGWRGSPHARGDGPQAGTLVILLPAFSPRAWGWSAVASTDGIPSGVLPTRVGMVRGDLTQHSSWLRSPHARGDGPSASRSSASCQPFSPRAWGYSVTMASYAHPESLGPIPHNATPSRQGVST